MELKELLYDGAKTFGMELSDRQLEQFFIYMSLLKEWNEKINLTAIEEESDIIIKHFIDSLSILPYITADSKLIDIGTGAGFPGIPLNIALGIEVTLMDSLAKRVKFLNEVIDRLALKGINAVHGRAEDFGRTSGYREVHSHATARAVASLPVLLEYCLPFVKAGGTFIAMKGSSNDEVKASNKALQLLGGEITKISELVLPFSDIKRNIIIIKKLRQTPTKYPRKAGKPSKEPLI